MTVMLTVCYINRRPGTGYHYSDTNACGESAASNKSCFKQELRWFVTYIGRQAEFAARAHSSQNTGQVL